jgi:sialate O-acetylesterase
MSFFKRKPEDVAALGAAASPLYKVRKRSDWDQVFARMSGWTGSDNTYSIPLTDSSSATEPLTLFTFGDSFVGEVDPVSHARSEDSVMVNNAVGIFRGREALAKALDVWLGEAQNGFLATSYFRPLAATEGEKHFTSDVPQTSDHIKTLNDSEYYWLQDGFCENGFLYIFASRVAPDPDGPEGFRFKVLGTDLLRLNLGTNGLPDKASMTVIPIPFDIRKEKTSTYFGAAVNTTDPHFNYLYGLYQDGGANLVAARVPKDSIENFNLWEFWSKDSWNRDYEHMDIIASGISSECAVERLDFGPDKGLYALIYNRDGIEPYVEMRLGQSFVGPFGDPVVLYNCPEADDDKGIYCYNAKAHPELSDPGTLLISYNVNTRKDAWHMMDGTIYRTKWLELYSEPLTLHPLLQDHAVLQREKSLEFSGKARPNSPISLQMDEEKWETIADADGNFSVKLLPRAKGGPYQMIWTSEDGTKILNDIYFGDVYLVGGQSNMQLSFKESSRYEEDLALFQDPLLRICQVPQRDRLPEESRGQTWDPGQWTVLQGEALDGFSAVASYMGLGLRQAEPDVPVGIVGAYMGATSAACWTSQESLDKHADLDVYREEFQARVDYWKEQGNFKEETLAFQAKAEAWNEKLTAYKEEHPDAIEIDIFHALGPGAWPPPEDENSFMRPAGLYYTMIKPLGGWVFRAIAFYQGENDTAHGKLYEELFQTMLADWRELFGLIPFIQVQLPAYYTGLQGPDTRGWGYVRQAQRQNSLTLDRVYHIVGLDQGQLGDLHPKKKYVLGQRLASFLQALHEDPYKPWSYARDAYVRPTLTSEKGDYQATLIQTDSLAKVEITVIAAEGTSLVYMDSTMGDARDRAVLSDSQFDLVIDGMIHPLSRDSVACEGQRLELYLSRETAQAIQEAKTVKLEYGMRDMAIATVGVADESGQIVGALEAFSIEVQ